MAVTFDQLTKNLSIVEDEVLEEVHAAKWDKAWDGSWRAVPKSPKRVESLFKTWEIWRAQYERLTPWVRDPKFIQAVELAERAVRFELFHKGAEDSRWKIVFQYEKIFSALRLCLMELARTNNEVTVFIDKYRAEFEQFRAENPYKWNVFVAINYDKGNEVVLIEKLLQDCEKSYHPDLKFHYAKNWAAERRITAELYDNLVFLMIACDAGLFFFTESNLSKKGGLHNPNVAFEFGFMSGLGRKCEMIKQDSVKPFTDVYGRLRSQYNDAYEVTELLRSFAENQLHLTRRSAAP
jgi:hypothetical protein